MSEGYGRTVHAECETWMVELEYSIGALFLFTVGQAGTGRGREGERQRQLQHKEWLPERGWRAVCQRGVGACDLLGSVWTHRALGHRDLDGGTGVLDWVAVAVHNRPRLGVNLLRVFGSAQKHNRWGCTLLMRERRERDNRLRARQPQQPTLLRVLNGTSLRPTTGQASVSTFSMFRSWGVRMHNLSTIVVSTFGGLRIWS